MTEPRQSSLGLLGALSAALSFLLLAGLGVLRLSVVPQFQAMFRDFSSADALPALTRVVVHPLYTLAGMLVVLAMISAGVVLALRRDRSRTIGRALLALTPLLALSLGCLLFVGLYMPIWSLAGDIKP